MVSLHNNSAGGNLSTVSCILAKERNGPQVAFQCLLYPTTDFSFHHRREKKGKAVNKSQTLSNDSMN